jgi:hypothetical protein
MCSPGDPPASLLYQTSASHLPFQLFHNWNNRKKETHKTRDNKKVKMKRKWSVQKGYQVAS